MNRLLLLLMTLLVVIGGGFMLLTGMGQNGNPLVVHEYNAVVPRQNQTSTAPPTQYTVPSDTQPNTVRPQPDPIKQPVGNGVNEYQYGSGADSADLSNEAVKENDQKLAVQTPDQKKTATAPKPAEKQAPKKQSSFDENGTFTLKKAMSKNGFHKGEPVVVVVDKGSHFTYVLQKQGEKVVIVYRASNATGAADTPSPPGPYKVSDVQKYPTWVPTKSIDPKQKPVQPYNKDHKNPLGVGRIRLNKFQVALHGTNDPSSIRKDASHGCIRHSNKDIEKIMSMVKDGDTVVITNKFVGTKLNKDMFS